MKDIQEGSDNFNNDFDKHNSPRNKRPNTLIDILMGIGISILTYAIVWLVSIGRYPITVVGLVELLILAAFVFLTVKFFRTQHKVCAIIMLILISPVIFFSLLIGACVLFVMPIGGM